MPKGRLSGHSQSYQGIIGQLLADGYSNFIQDVYPVRKCDSNSNINHAHLARACSNDRQKPIGNALTTLFFKDLRKKLESLYLTIW